MRELSIEEKAKRYDEALKVLHKYDGTNIMFSQSLKEEMFPELKESEDERIRGKIIATIHLYYGEPLEDEAKEMIAWLEKQGEQKTTIEMKTPEESLGIDSDTYNKVVDECIYGEQKLVEFKPSFRVGDVIKPKDPVLGEPRIVKGIHPKFGYDTNNGILDFEFEDNWELVEEPLIEDLTVELNKYIKDHFTIDKEQLDRFGIEEKNYMYSMDRSDMLAMVEHFTKWQKTNLWKPADGDDLPEIDREVIVLVKYNAQHNIHDEEYPTYRVGFGHRPNPDGWDGKNIDTNEVTHYTPKLYDKGGWNAPDIAYWLDV